MILFIDETYIKENSPMSANISPEDIYPYVLTAQESYIKETLGTSLYNYMITEGEQSPPWPEAVDVDLLYLIRKALLWYTNYDAIPFIWVKFRNIGLVLQSGDNMTSATDAQMQIVRNECLNKATWYVNELIRFLCANSSDYSEYNQGCWSCGDISPNSGPVNSMDLYIDKKANINQEVINFYKKFIL